MHQLVDLDREQIKALLRGGVFGRIAFNLRSGAVILPVNYAVVDDAIIVRTEPDSALGRHASGQRLAFEVDYVDYETWQEWSVVIQGVGEVVVDQPELQRIAEVWSPKPWATGDRSLFVRLVWDELSGRQLASNWDALSSMPVRRTLRWQSRGEA